MSQNDILCDNWRPFIEPEGNSTKVIILSLMKGSHRYNRIMSVRRGKQAENGLLSASSNSYCWKTVEQWRPQWGKGEIWGFYAQLNISSRIKTTSNFQTLEDSKKTFPLKLNHKRLNFSEAWGRGLKGQAFTPKVKGPVFRSLRTHIKTDTEV